MEDGVPLTEKEEISLVLEALALHRPPPLAVKRSIFTPADSSMFKVN
jgi:hypothetical protein